MKTTSTLFETVEKEIIDSTYEIFSTMIPLEIKSGKVFNREEKDIQEEVMSLVSFSGEHSGIIALFCSRKIALKITSLMLGIDTFELDHDTKDAIGEVTNMIAGNLKNRVYTDLGTMHLAVPLVVAGTDMTISSSSRENGECTHSPLYVKPANNQNMWVIFPFSSAEGTFHVGMKINHEKS
ncbi:MAG: chemotaxis protein CheX [Candidatus Scalindua sp.]|nr:chemotaxis protein CheX [Candidatus Scalindua sp.]